MARFKNSFPMVHDTLVGNDGQWMGLDDFQPFWAARRIAEVSSIVLLLLVDQRFYSVARSMLYYVRTSLGTSSTAKAGATAPALTSGRGCLTG